MEECGLFKGAARTKGFKFRVLGFGYRVLGFGFLGLRFKSSILCLSHNRPSKQITF